MTVSDVIARGIRIELHEAAAIVRDMVERGAIAVSSSVPDLHQVEIVREGHVEIHGGRRVDDPVKQLVELLRNLIPHEIPAQLELLTTYPPPSVEEFSVALAYFERPNRAAILQGLFARAMTGYEAAPGPDAMIASLRAASAISPPVANAEKEEASRAARLKKLLIAVAVLGLVAAIGAAVVLVQRQNTAVEGAEANSLTTRVSEKVSDVTSAVGNAVASLGERVGIGGSPAPAPQPAVTTEPSKPQKVPALRTTRSRRAPSERDDPPNKGEGAVVTPDAIGVSPTEMTSVVVRAEPSPDFFAAEPGAVYTASSPDVTAPVPVRPQLPRATVAAARDEDIARIELLISATGRVETVKLLDEPRTVHDSMLLSAAKAWRFRPATKDGYPVRFRTVVVVGREPNRQSR